MEVAGSGALPAGPGALPGELALVAPRLDAGQQVPDQQHLQLLELQAQVPGDALHPQIAELNEPGAAAARLVLAGTTEPSVKLPGLIERHLMTAGRKSVLVFLPESEQERKSKRQRELPADVKYDGSLSGRVNFLFSDAPKRTPLIGKRTKVLKRQQDGSAVRQITVHEVRCVVQVLAAQVQTYIVLPSLELTDDGTAAPPLELKDDGTAVLRIRQAGRFSGARQVVRLAGMGDGFDGFYAVVAADNQGALSIKLPKKEAAEAEEEIQEAVAAGRVTVREEYVLYPLILYQFMLDREPPPQQLEQQEQQPVPPPGAFPEFLAMPLHLPDMGPLPSDLFGGPLSGTGWVPGQQQQQQQFPTLSLGGQSALGAGNVCAAVAAAQPQEHAVPPRGTAQEQSHSSGGAASPTRQPALGAATADSHRGGEQHYARLTVGPPARGDLHALEVEGSANINGELHTRGQLVTSDARCKEEIRAAFVEVDRAVDIARDITVCMYRYRGSDTQHLGVIAQGVHAALQKHGAEDLNLVRQGPQGLLSVDFGGLQVLALAALQKVASDCEEQAALLLAVMGRLQQLETARAQWAAGAAGGGGGGSDVLRAASGATMTSSASGAALSAASSMVLLLDSGDVEMASSEGGEEEEGGEEADGKEEEEAGELAGMSAEQAVNWLVDRLSDEPGSRGAYKAVAYKLSLAALWECYQEAANEPPGMVADGSRPRTRGGQFLWLAKKRVAAEKARQKREAAGLPQLELRDYQQRLMAAAQDGANVILVAPTGAGKTAVAIVHAQQLLEGDPEARVVFLAPTVTLVAQQADAFFAAPAFSSGTFKVDHRSRDNPLAPSEWAGALKASHVMVLTPQLFLNMLDAGVAHFSQIALLVLDECHHATGRHSVSKVLAHYHKSEKRTQILGLTASPVSKAGLQETYAALTALERNLDAKLVVLDEHDEELRRTVPTVEELELRVATSAQDASLARRLGAFTLKAVAAVEALCGELGVADKLGPLPREVVGMLSEGRWCSTAVHWTVAVAERLKAAQQGGAAQAAQAAQHDSSADGGVHQAAQHDATNALLLVRAAVAALALVADVGFEAAVRHLCGEYYAVAAKLVPADCRPAHGGDASHGGDMPVTAALLAVLAQEVDQAGVLADALSPEAAGALSRHPKFTALAGFLKERYAAQDAFHGIVFARTREAARSLAALILASPDLNFLESVQSFMGHGGGSAKGAGGGMSTKQQRAAMEQFRQPGRRLLVATAAAEEGIDVPHCEVVVRYSAVQTGRELVQSRGRARSLGSCFVHIIAEGSAEGEAAAVTKARREEESLRAALRGMALRE